MHNEKDLAYIAGFLDGEGCISISKRTNKVKNPSPGQQVYEYYRPNVQIVNSNPDVLSYIMTTLPDVRFGFIVNNDARPNVRQCFRVYIKDMPSIVLFCTLMLPYLRVKKRHAEIVLQLLWISEAIGHMRDDTGLVMEPLYQEIKSLNMKGGDPHRE